MHRIAVMSFGSVDSLPHNGRVVTLMTVCGTIHGASYGDPVMSVVVGPVIVLVAVIAPGAAFGSS